MTSESEQDDSSGTQPTSEPEPKVDPKQPPATPDSKTWQGGDPDSRDDG